ncbi:PhzF family phenazine biosynthesis protein [Indioceanicola profundi]|uniref:PhzF family phenazine biosynthesis protein n=1 Tax=Indioceanicola profundi TaxID=2220096 RepID=UPI000E6AB987|nr:PhzF family phenazine biosynthesis protein [Indioceanicola profundi]
MRLSMYQVDAFTSRIFGGNPAAVIPLEAPMPSDLMQAIAAENNLSETAFLVPEGDRWGLRWFTPEVEVDLCGHATLASAFVIAEVLRPGADRMVFRTEQAGELTVERTGDIYTLDFPSRPPQPAIPPAELLPGLGGPAPVEVRKARDWFVVYETAQQVLDLKPNFERLSVLPDMAIVTAPGPLAGEEGVDFVSRFFAPGKGIAEDPVTGSAHCSLIPYWAEKLGKSTLKARQVSRRGGDLSCALVGDRVRIGGQAVMYMEGSIRV